jgi:hypothetical protein
MEAGIAMNKQMKEQDRKPTTEARDFLQPNLESGITFDEYYSLDLVHTKGKEIKQKLKARRPASLGAISEAIYQ